ncbi:hypothetical protein A605_12615 [Corynebacterium halotolerans YIM 70093 = DSM 44683]|uniref:Uncharacterized protein n=2 Tax=Corynebacterium halotolerans TaxID=225326 RepID=M1N0T8_9CORY|nr:hypothetical protein A605_12615 [Corynebacterium halotolerans YIM 70093 = DSM 44683]
MVDWVWTMPDFGVTWCRCTPDPLTGLPPHSVTRPLITHHLVRVLGSVPDRVSNQEISLVVMDLWKFPAMAPPIAEALMRSVKAVNGLMGQDYPTNTALAVIKHFSNTWNGEPAR